MAVAEEQKRNEAIAATVRAYFGLRDDVTPDQVEKALTRVVVEASIHDRRIRESPTFTITHAEATPMVEAIMDGTALRSVPSGSSIVTLRCTARVGTEGLSIPIGGQMRMLLQDVSKK